MNIQSHTQQPSTPSYHEQILVVRRTTLFDATPAWHGIRTTGIKEYVDLICAHQEFQPRTAMEIDPTYKQIIPYMIFHHKDRYFLMQRRSTASETRLQNLYTLGIGGHIRQEDLVGTNLMDWARREFYEEITYEGNLTVRPVGVLNDDSNEVGRVHLGLVLVLTGDSDSIRINSELKSGKLVTLASCRTYYEHLESWSKHVLEYLEM